jgi:hypothetical protein
MAESIRAEARRTGLSKSTIHRRRQIEDGKVDTDRYVVDAKEAAVLLRRLLSRLARDSRYPFACPREVREAIESIRVSIGMIGVFVGEQRVGNRELAEMARAAVDAEPEELRRTIARLLGGGYIAQRELVAQDGGLGIAQLMDFVNKGDLTHIDMIRLGFRRWVEEAVPDPGTLPSAEDIREGNRRLQAMLGSMRDPAG